MTEPSERYLAVARSIIRETQEECGLFHVHTVGKIRDSLVECRREAIEECAKIAERYREDGYYDIEGPEQDIRAIADQPAPAATPTCATITIDFATAKEAREVYDWMERHSPIRGGTLGMQTSSTAAPPSEAEVEAAMAAVDAADLSAVTPEFHRRELYRLALVAAAKVRAR